MAKKGLNSLGTEATCGNSSFGPWGERRGDLDSLVNILPVNEER
jgi:hypothetical protein